MNENQVDVESSSFDENTSLGNENAFLENEELKNNQKRKNWFKLAVFSFAFIAILLVIYFLFGLLREGFFSNENDIAVDSSTEEDVFNGCDAFYLDIKRDRCYVLLAKINADTEGCKQENEKEEGVKSCEESLERLLNREEKYDDLPIVQECKNIDPWENGSENYREFNEISRKCAYGYAIENPSICEQKDFNFTTKNTVNWRESCYLSVAIETGNYSLCNNLEGKAKDSCLENVFYTDYIPDDCSTIKTPYNDYCSSYFGVTLNNESYCNEIDDSVLKNECLMETSNMSRMDEDFYKDDLCVKLAYISNSEDGEKKFIYDGKDTGVDINTNMKTFWYDENAIIFVKETSKRKYIYIDGRLIGEINPSYEYLQYIIYHDGVLIFNDVNDNFVVYKDGKTKTYRNGDFSSHVEDADDYFQKRDYLLNKYMGGSYWLENEQEGRVSRSFIPYEKKSYEVGDMMFDVSMKPLVIDGRTTNVYGTISGLEQTLGRHLVFEFTYHDEEHIKQDKNTISSAVFFDGKIIKNAEDPVLLKCEHKLTLESK